MSNDYLTWTPIVEHSDARSDDVNDIGAAVEAAFDKLPSADRVKRHVVDAVDAGGSPNVITVTSGDEIQSYALGQRVLIRTSADNTGPVTINLDGLGAKTALRENGMPLEGNDMVGGRIYEFIYDGEAFQMTRITSGLLANALLAAAAAVEASGISAGIAQDSADTAVASAGIAVTSAAAAQDDANAAAVSAAAAAVSAAEAAAAAAPDPTGGYTVAQVDLLLAAKASTTALAALSTTVDGKASTTALASLATTVDTKASLTQLAEKADLEDLDDKASLAQLAEKASLTQLADKASLAQLATKAALSGGNQFSGRQRVAVVALTDAATVTPNLADGNIFTLTMTANRAIANPSGMADAIGQEVLIVFRGAFQASFGSQYKFPRGTPPVFTGSLNAIGGTVISATEILMHGAVGYA